MARGDRSRMPQARHRPRRAGHDRPARPRHPRLSGQEGEDVLRARPMLCASPLILALLAQAPPAVARDVRAARLELMKQSVASYEILRAGGREGTYRLRPEPVLRFTNPVGDSEDGAIFFWLDGDGRPGVAAQVFLSRWRR